MMMGEAGPVRGAALLVSVFAAVVDCRGPVAPIGYGKSRRGGRGMAYALTLPV